MGERAAVPLADGSVGSGTRVPVGLNVAVGANVAVGLNALEAS
jgi:hypothetical protein